MGENANLELNQVASKITCSPENWLKRTLEPLNSPSKHKKIRLDMVPVSCNSLSKTKRKTKNTVVFRYGNYDRYYGYRMNSKDFKDVRLDAFQKHRNLFEGCKLLDIGCNNGLVTMSIARDFLVKHIVGLDIDKTLVSKAQNLLNNEKRNCEGNGFPFNIEFKCGNYVLAANQLLNLEVEQFDTILCLSVIKWIHLNCGDNGVKLAFQRMHKQLVPGGRLILEAQEWKSYKRRKNLNPDIASNYKNIKFLPEHFDAYLLGHEVGFASVFSIEVPMHHAKGFQRPIKVFVK